MAAFILLAALMLAAALAFVLIPLLRGRTTDASPNDARRLLALLDESHKGGILSDDEYAAKRAELGERLLGALDVPAAPAHGYPIAIAIALLLPLAAIVLYRLVGTPAALGSGALTQAQAPADHGADMQQAIAKLADKLKQNPEDAEGWALLGRAYEATQRFAEARDALKHAYDLAKGDPDVAVAYAEALALSSPTRRIDGEPRQILDAALKSAPDNQRGLWLLGISEYQGRNYDNAIAAWKRLLGVLPKDSDIIPSVQQQIARAEAERDGKPMPSEQAQAAGTTAQETESAPASESGPQLHVEVALDPKLKDRLAPGDVLFVYAKAASGPPMPLAIQRMAADKLPIAVTLTDGMGMLPSMKLSQFPQVVIGARVSKSGNAMPQSGDLEVLSKPVDVTTTEPIRLTINQIVP
ncbi:MAG: c-type cytochrome biogenesis protein CcmI [Proteobacteria bacterium]|nr:c-type cytochrome biogenesis protein CcmI [Pseudomonadota bacterium]